MIKYPDFLSVITMDSVDSTNSYLKRELPTLTSKFPVLATAGRQSGGRGRELRIWDSPPGLGLYSSFGFSLDGAARLNLLALVAGIAVIEALKRLQPDLPLGLKWPNDVLSGGLKLAGVLIENIIFPKEVICIVGMGVNLGHEYRDFPLELREKAVSLKMQTGVVYTAPEVNPVLAHFFFQGLERLRNNECEVIIEAANRYCQHLKVRELTFHHNNKVVSGFFKGIGDDGGMILETADGGRSVYYSGEIGMEKS